VSGVIYSTLAGRFASCGGGGNAVVVVFIIAVQ
jgi:hypothetical protein